MNRGDASAGEQTSQPEERRFAAIPQDSSYALGDSKSGPSVLVALATYNEIENLPSLVEAILRELPTADILVIDDNSPDGTGCWCDKQSAIEPRLRCLHRPRKQGLGSATLEGVAWALKQEYDIFITMDADWSHDPSCLPQLIAATANGEVAIGSRYCPGGRVVGWPIHRQAASLGMNYLSRLVLRISVRDLSGAFRAYPVTLLKRLDFSQITATGYSYLEEILWHLQRVGAAFVEVPITFRDRRAGQSKISVREVSGKLATLLKLARRKN